MPACNPSPCSIQPRPHRSAPSPPKASVPLPAHSGSVRGLQETVHKPLGGEVKCMDVSPILEGRTGAPFLAVGMADASVRIFSLGAEDMLEPRATQVSLGFRVSVLGFSWQLPGFWPGSWTDMARWTWPCLQQPQDTTEA